MSKRKKASKKAREKLWKRVSRYSRCCFPRDREDEKLGCGDCPYQNQCDARQYIGVPVQLLEDLSELTAGR